MKNEELIKAKRDFLTSMGFQPMLPGDTNTLFTMEKMVFSVADDHTSLEDLKRQVMNILKIRGVVEGDPEPNEEPEPEPEQAKESESEQPAAPTGKEPASDEYDPFGEGIESVDPFYLCDELKKVKTPVFMRLTLDGNRYYYTVKDTGEVLIYASATNLIKDGYVEKRDGLTDWKQFQKLIGKNPEEVAQYEADKGTIMHYLYGLYLTGRDIVLRRSSIVNLVKESDLKISKENKERFCHSQSDLDDMMERLKRFAKFCWDYKVKPLAIEKILCCTRYQVASPIDLIAEITYTVTEEGYFGEVYQKNGPGYQKGDPKKSKRTYEKSENVIIDFKSGSIQPHHALQLHLYRLMCAEWYPDFHIARIFNFSPKSESSRKYTFREQTDNKEIRKADAVFTQGMINHENKDKVFTMNIGVLNIKNEFKEEDYTITYNIADELSKRLKQ